MLAMGRGLMVDPDLMLIDEPSAGFVPDLADDVFEKIVEINGSGTAILMMEQNARQALRTGDRGYVLEMGENRFEDDADVLLDNPEVEELYLGGAVEESSDDWAGRRTSWSPSSRSGDEPIDG
jgi:branched-chain amino acid transport system ATP-binding protein